jgi:preprotein translocase subunit SecG
MEVLLIIFHILICLALIMVVLLQTGKGADMGAAFGGGSSQTLFGSTGASTFLTKSTTMVAVAFMLTSLGLAYISSSKTGASIMQDVEAPIEESVLPPGEAEVPVPNDQVAATANSVQPAEEGRADDTEQK